MSSAKPEPRPLPKRFYESASISKVGEDYHVLLDGKPVRTPAKHFLQHASQKIAAAIAAEWDAQKTVINTETMPLTRLASISIDRAANDREAWLQDVLRYVETDLLCYRAPRSKEEAALRARQDAAFDPILAWIAEEFAATFLTTEGVMPLQQPEASYRAVEAVFAAATDGELAALTMMVPPLGSALLALAVWKQQVGVEDALIAARLDEDEQAGQWGLDVSAQALWEAKAKDVRSCAFFLTHNRL